MSSSHLLALAVFACTADLAYVEAWQGAQRIGSRGDLDEEAGQDMDRVSSLLLEQAAELEHLLSPADSSTDDYLLNEAMPEDSDPVWKGLHQSSGPVFDPPLNGDSAAASRDSPLGYSQDDDGGRPRGQFLANYHRPLPRNDTDPRSGSTGLDTMMGNEKKLITFGGTVSLGVAHIIWICLGVVLLCFVACCCWSCWTTLPITITGETARANTEEDQLHEVWFRSGK